MSINCIHLGSCLSNGGDHTSSLQACQSRVPSAWVFASWVLGFGLMALFFASFSLSVSSLHGFSIIFVINSLNMDLKSTTCDCHSVAELSV
jgi:hypothetical protein